MSFHKPLRTAIFAHRHTLTVGLCRLCESSPGRRTRKPTLSRRLSAMILPPTLLYSTGPTDYEADTSPTRRRFTGPIWIIVFPGQPTADGQGTFFFLRVQINNIYDVIKTPTVYSRAQ